MENGPRVYRMEGWVLRLTLPLALDKGLDERMHMESHVHWSTGGYENQNHVTRSLKDLGSYKYHLGIV